LGLDLRTDRDGSIVTLGGFRCRRLTGSPSPVRCLLSLTLSRRYGRTRPTLLVSRLRLSNCGYQAYGHPPYPAPGYGDIRVIPVLLTISLPISEQICAVELPRSPPRLRMLVQRLRYSTLYPYRIIGKTEGYPAPIFSIKRAFTSSFLSHDQERSPKLAIQSSSKSGR
jgi:hypothetical protein